MKKSIVKDVAVFLILLAVAAVLCYFLPEKVPVHFNAQGGGRLSREQVVPSAGCGHPLFCVLAVFPRQ